MPRSPFPGMDPYLEAPGLWPDVHARLMNIFAEQLTPLLAPKYVAELNTQIVIDRILDEPPETRAVLPDVTITQPDSSAPGAVTAAPVAPAPLRLAVPMAVPTRLVSVYIRLREAERLVAVIELLSPINKRPGDGRREYLEKRATFLETGIHLIEIDLLRKWRRMPLEGTLPDSAYLAMVSNAYERPACDVWPIGLRQPLPVLPIPLLRPDPPVSLDMGQALRTAYERARYDLRIDYDSPPTPSLSPEDAAWAATLLAQEA
jgi:hypothetical protein